MCGEMMDPDPTHREMWASLAKIHERLADIFGALHDFEQRITKLEKRGEDGK